MPKPALHLAPLATLAALAALTACSTSSPPAPAPADSQADAPRQESAPTSTGEDAASSGLRMPAAGEYLALSDPSYGYMKAAAGAPSQGERAPDFELLTHTGETLRLSEALAEGPVVLMFYRGFW